MLIPGPTDSWRSYKPVLGSLPDHLRVVAVSLRGHGDSSQPPTGYRVEDLASDIVAFLDGLEIDRAVLVGHSGSCLVARHVALDTPERVVGLFLEASPLTLRGDEGLRDFVSSTVSPLTSPVDRESARSFLTLTSTENLAPALLEDLVEDLAKVPVQAWKEMFKSLLEYDDTPELARIGVPVALAWGDEDQLVSRQMQDELLERLPRAELTVYEGSGHTPRWEAASRFARHLADFSSPLLASPPHQ